MSQLPEPSPEVRRLLGSWARDLVSNPKKRESFERQFKLGAATLIKFLDDCRTLGPEAAAKKHNIDLPANLRGPTTR